MIYSGQWHEVLLSPPGNSKKIEWSNLLKSTKKKIAKNWITNDCIFVAFEENKSSIIFHLADYTFEKSSSLHLLCVEEILHAANNKKRNLQTDWFNAQCSRCQIKVAQNRTNSDQYQNINFVVRFSKIFVLTCSYLSSNYLEHIWVFANGG